MRLAYITPSCSKPALFAVRATTRKGEPISQTPRRKSKPGARRTTEIKLRINNYHNTIGFLARNIVHRIQTVDVVAKFTWRDLFRRKTLLEDPGFLIVICASFIPARTPIPVHRSSASYIRPTSLQRQAAMAPRLPKEVGVAIELAIKIAHSKGKRPDLENIALIFDTTYQSVSQIRRRINTIAITGIDPRKNLVRRHWVERIRMRLSGVSGR
jgi:hypothetical protein